ncbi:flagellin modification protein A [Campylobacter mucosalis]|uniref:oxidoreductase n=1 Tax=Campylobacter mucosalis TaxID=202 RepID=UPI0004D8D017|nr:oxidoreductase [Campylobacter mucosalis]KEA45831.1 flagellin modification protein A [Campylobacter mucosalis]QKF62358.1 glucosamine-6-P synthase, glutaminase subunit PtmA [Campylobacter mucosalis]
MLKDKVVVVTGGAGRIGSEFIRAIVKNNGVGVIAEVDTKRANKLKDEILNTHKNAKVEALQVDISDKKSINELINFLHEKYGKIDALVNNAYPKSKNYGRKFFEIGIDDFNEFLGLHLGGYFNISQSFISYFLNQKFGNIINISSIQGIGAPAFETYEGTNMHSPIEYTAVKHGLIGMSKYMAKMFKKDGIRLNAISPGGILDAQPEPFLSQYKKRCGTKGMLDATDICGALVYLLSDASMFVNGQNIVVDDGFSL